MTEIIKKQLQEKINNLLEIYQGLKKLQRLTLKDLEANIETKGISKICHRSAVG